METAEAVPSGSVGKTWADPSSPAGADLRRCLGMFYGGPEVMWKLPSAKVISLSVAMDFDTRVSNALIDWFGFGEQKKDSSPIPQDRNNLFLWSRPSFSHKKIL